VSTIEDLVKRLCPGGVPLNELGELGSFVRGSGIQKKDLIDSGFPAIHYGQIHTDYGSEATETVSFVSPEYAEKLRKAEPGDLVIATTSEDDEGVGKAVAWLGDSAAAVSGDAYIYRHRLVPKYMSYFFQSSQFRNQKKRGITGTKVRRISGDALAKIKLYVPPIEVQEAIVKVLDLYESLDAELGAKLEEELKARWRQYSYYRDRLLRFSESSIEWSTMGEIAVNLDSRRRPVTKSAREPGEIPYYGASGIVDYVSDYIFDGDYLLVSEDGANLLARSSPIAFTASGKTWINNHAHVLEFETYAERRFVELYLNSIDLAPYVSDGPQPKLTKANLNRIPVPQPKVADQERIVDMLDRLGSLVNGLSIALPAEGKARRQQYEFYRERLLTFEVAAI
jgi:type I restriction enzyme, S subunit